MDIVIYMNEEDFKHKTSDGIYAYWSMGRVPTDKRDDPFTELSRIHLAAKEEKEDG